MRARRQVEAVDGLPGASLAGRHEVRVRPEREARIAVTEVLAQGPDALAGIQQHEVAFIADRVASGRTYKRNEQTQTVSRVPAPAVVAQAHGLPEGTEVYARARVVKEGSQPTHTLTSYYRPEHVEGTRIVDPTPGPAGRGGGFRVLYDAGYEIDHMQETLFARVPTADEVQLLQLAPGEWVVELHRTTYTADGTVVEFAIGVHAATRFAWTYDFKVPDSAEAEGESK
ncbi:UTRA domain-containing protein [Streptomyces albogriseolus]|uniref:UTRA domain-containing protein n=1 Tax=Streptomyces albogriseolus TaxID=1887 RepID=UPI0034612060